MADKIRTLPVQGPAPAAPPAGLANTALAPCLCSNPVAA